jgi:hypothetical protein
VSNREQNERRFKQWEDLPDGGRRYWYDVLGHAGYRARYVKIVNADEVTIEFLQEIYDGEGRLVSVHQKFPNDRGHVDVE